MVPRNNIDFIRTVLALGVMAMHTFATVGIWYPQFPWVPAFIAISGFLITASMERSLGYGDFAWRRLLRVGPAFVLSLAPVAGLGGNVHDALIDWILMGFGSGGSNPPLWSLSLEEVLYFCLAVWFALGIYGTWHKAVSALFAMFILVAIAAIFASEGTIHIYMVTLTFISGTFLYVVRDKIIWSTLGGLLCLAITIWMRNSGLTAPPIYAVLIGPLIAYGLITIAFHTKPIFSGYKETIGDPSFGIYVYHFPIMLWLQVRGVEGVWLFPGTLTLTILTALASWHAVEKHLLKLKGYWQPSFG